VPVKTCAMLDPVFRRPLRSLSNHERRCSGVGSAGSMASGKGCAAGETAAAPSTDAAGVSGADVKPSFCHQLFSPGASGSSASMGAALGVAADVGAEGGTADFFLKKLNMLNEVSRSEGRKKEAPSIAELRVGARQRALALTL